MSKTFKIPFAFTPSGEVMDIENAVKGETYLCSCGADVKLRGGEIISNHFYHLNESECSLESSIHKAYKAVFLNTKQIKLPHDVNGSDVLTFDRVELERKIDDYVPDAIGYIGDKMYLIEFAKTSYIGVRKEKKIKKSNLFCLEVSIVDTINTIKAIEEHLTQQSFYKEVIHIPEYEEMREMREKFKVAYRELQEANRNLKWEISSLKQDVNSWKHKYEQMRDEGLAGGLYKGINFPMFFKRDCKNGAKLYKRELQNGSEIIGFEKNGVFNIKFDII
jgi:hypothetical protein